MRYRWKRGLLAALVVVVMPAVAGLTAATAAAAEPDCRVSADAPHVSRGAGGVIAKTRFTCEHPRSATYNEVLINLTHGPSGATAIGGTFLTEAATPGEASDLCIDALLAAADAENLHVVETQEVVVVPGWRDERDW